ncbi:MAG: tRNA (adenosine(37)-N6)-threonylcarbamoyltransferase complex ATPase subunit type 1 TsaE [Clostridia bacterium]|nr:tRNA (adenosine(37)-N6)-threonylcarbamoyltransferase complex ATPase subunit type 1 TsaE [Clostridia bacterium]
MADKYYTASAAETEKVGAEFAARLAPGDFVALYGELGAGKTAFVRGMARVLAPGAAVSSPTYALVNVYEGEKCELCHFDMYRIHDEDDLYSIGFWDYDGCVFAVEWAENVPFALPDRYYAVAIAKTGEDGREITIEERGN